MTIRDGLRIAHDCGPCPAVPLQGASLRGHAVQPAPAPLRHDRSHLVPVTEEPGPKRRSPEYNRRHNERAREQQKAWKAAHRERIAAWQRAYRARKRAAG